MGISTVVADDEQPALARLVRLLEHYQDIDIVGRASNGKETLRVVKEKAPKLLFLDIRMPEPDGLEVAADLAEWEEGPIVVFLTAYEEHALEAFELAALDYLVKPVRRERLTKCVERVRLAIRDRNLSTASPESAQEKFPTPIALSHADPRVDERHLVPLEDISYFTSRDERTYACVKDAEYPVNTTLQALQESLPNHLFLRTHRAYIVNLGEVSGITPWAHRSFNLTLKNGHQVPLSRGYAQAFKQRVNWF